MVRQTSQNLKVPERQNSTFIALMKGIIYGYIITVPIFIAFALVLTYTKFPEKYISPVVIITTIISVIFAGSASAKGSQNKGWLLGSVVGLLYMIILYLSSSIAFNNFSIDRYVLINGLIGMLSGAIGGIVGTNSKTKTRSRIKPKTKIKKRRGKYTRK